MTSAAWNAWVGRAKAADIAAFAAKRNLGLKRDGKGGKYLVGPCPRCGGSDKFAISTTKSLFNCRGCEKAGDVIALAQFLDGCDFNRAVETLTGEPPPEEKPARKKPNGAGGRPLGVLVESYDYADELGELLFQTCRYDPKNFRQRRPNGKGGWVWNLNGVRLVPYRLSLLIEAVGVNQTVLVVEGERDVETAEALGLRATCNPMGAGKWRDEYDRHFADADVLIIPDNDEAGWRHANSVGAHLRSVAARVRVLVLPDAKDLSAWVESGGTREQLDALIASAPEWAAPESAPDEPPADAGARARAAQGEDDLIAALSRMRPGVEFSRERARAAKALGVSRRAVDDEIEARRADKEAPEAAPLYPHWFVDPWPETVDSDALLRDIIARLRKHVTCTESDALTVALWTMFSWVHDEIAVHSPMLLLTSALPESGKTSMLGVLSFLTPRCIRSVEISEAALYRSISLWHPTSSSMSSTPCSPLTTRPGCARYSIAVTRAGKSSCGALNQASNRHRSIPLAPKLSA